MSLIKRFSKSPQVTDNSVVIDEFEGAKKFGLTVLGIIIGSLFGFWLRPSVPVIGQLPFRHVITRGSDLSGVEAFLVPVAQESFNYLLFGTILGGVIGASAGYFLVNRKTALDKPSSQINTQLTQPAEARTGSGIAERIKELSDLKDKGILTEEEFQAKKTELLNRL